MSISHEDGREDGKFAPLHASRRSLAKRRLDGVEDKYAKLEADQEAKVNQQLVVLLGGSCQAAAGGAAGGAQALTCVRQTEVGVPKEVACGPPSDRDLRGLDASGGLMVPFSSLCDGGPAVDASNSGKEAEGAYRCVVACREGYEVAPLNPPNPPRLMEVVCVKDAEGGIAGRYAAGDASRPPTCQPIVPKLTKAEFNPTGTVISFQFSAPTYQGRRATSKGDSQMNACELYVNSNVMK